MVKRGALPLLLAIWLAGCLSTPPSGVITCDNNCPISGFYCAADGYCWLNGEYPTSTSATSATSASAGGGKGTSGGSSGGSSGTGSSGGTAQSTGSSGSSTGHPSGTSSRGTTTR